MQTLLDGETARRLMTIPGVGPATAATLLAEIGDIRSDCARKRAAGTSAMNAVGHCMSKVLALVWGIWRSGRDFDPHHGEATP